MGFGAVVVMGFGGGDVLVSLRSMGSDLVGGKKNRVRLRRDWGKGRGVEGW